MGEHGRQIDWCIERLIENETPAGKASEETIDKPTATQDEEVLESLVTAEEIEVRAKEASSDLSISSDADSSVIDSLLQNQGDEDTQDNK